MTESVSPTASYDADWPDQYTSFDATAKKAHAQAQAHGPAVPGLDNEEHNSIEGGVEPTEADVERHPDDSKPGSTYYSYTDSELDDVDQPRPAFPATVEDEADTTTIGIRPGYRADGRRRYIPFSYRSQARPVEEAKAKAAETSGLREDDTAVPAQGSGDADASAANMRNNKHGFEPLQLGEQDVILAMHFDFYGTRLVTGSADHRIRVVRFKPEGGHELMDTWRGHNGEVLDVKWSGRTAGKIIGSISEDLRMKIWEEDEREELQSGRRWKLIYSQSCGHQVVYASLDFLNLRYDTVLALITRDGMLSLMEPVDADTYDDWKEDDQVWICGDRIPRGQETRFKVAFQQSELPCYQALIAGLDKSAISLAVSAMDVVKVFRVLRVGQGEDGPYQFQQPVAVLTGTQGLVRDVAWSDIMYLPFDIIATASSDGYIRFYEIQTPLPKESDPPKPSSSTPQAASSSATMPAREAQAPKPSGIGAGLASKSLTDSMAVLNIGQIKHEWKMIDEIREDGVWTIRWIPFQQVLVGNGDAGRVHIYKKSIHGKWTLFADFGPEEEPITGFAAAPAPVADPST